MASGSPTERHGAGHRHAGSAAGRRDWEEEEEEGQGWGLLRPQEGWVCTCGCEGVGGCE